MAINVRDEQLFRQAVVQNVAKVRDLQVFRQAVVSTKVFVRDEQVFRQAVVVLGAAPSLYTMCFAAT